MYPCAPRRVSPGRTSVPQQRNGRHATIVSETGGGLTGVNAHATALAAVARAGAGCPPPCSGWHSRPSEGTPLRLRQAPLCHDGLWLGSEPVVAGFASAGRPCCVPAPDRNSTPDFRAYAAGVQRSFCDSGHPAITPDAGARPDGGIAGAATVKPEPRRRYPQRAQCLPTHAATAISPAGPVPANARRKSDTPAGPSDNPRTAAQFSGLMPACLTTRPNTSRSVRICFA